MATFLSNTLTLKTSESSLGRYWIANDDIPSGTLLIKESPIVSIPNLQINNANIKDPIDHKANSSLCWNCCRFFPSDDQNNHYCSTPCKQSQHIMDIILSPSLSFNKLITNDLTLRLTIFMLLKLLYHRIKHNQNLSETFKEFITTPSKFYEIFTLKTITKYNKLLQHTMSHNMDSNTLYQSYLHKLSQIIPPLMNELSLELNQNNVYTLSVHVLNIIFINSFGIHYSLIHDEDMLGLSLYYNASFLNHSCSPNAMYYFINGNEIIIRTVRNVSRNECITISIVDDMECFCKERRQEMMLAHFGFKCLCIRCVDEEYINSDALLSERVHDIDSIINNKEHGNILKFARINWKNNAESIGWKFYKRLFDEYRYYYHPFDVGVLSLMEEISQRAFMICDYKIGFDAAELGQEFAVRLMSSNIVDNAHRREFKFIVLSFVNYLYMIEDKYPGNNDDNNKDIVVMNDDILASMFEDEAMVNIEDEVDFVDNVETDAVHEVNVDMKWSEFEENVDIIKSVNVKKRRIKKKKNRKQRGNKGRKGSKYNNYKNKKIKGKKCRLTKDANVKVYTFGNTYDDRKGNRDVYDNNTLEYELNEKIIGLCATRSILFPKFKEFEQWIGRDLMRLDPKIEIIVTLLKDKFDEDV